LSRPVSVAQTFASIPVFNTLHARSPAVRTFRLEVNERSTDVFDVLDDERYLTDRPHMHDAAYEGYVRNAEQAGMLPAAAAAGASRRDVLSLALTQVGAQRPLTNNRTVP